MKRGERYYSYECGCDVIILKDINSMYVLGGRPNFRSADIYAKSELDSIVGSNYKESDVKYILENIKTESIDYNIFVDECEKYRMFSEIRLTEIVESINIPGLKVSLALHDIEKNKTVKLFNAVSGMSESENDFDVYLDTYVALNDIQFGNINDRDYYFFKIENKVENTVEYIAKSKTDYEDKIYSGTIKAI